MCIIKRLFVWFLILCMAFQMTGCQKKNQEKEKIKDEVIKEEQESEEDSGENPWDDVEEEAEVPEPVPEPTPTPTPTPAPDSTSGAGSASAPQQQPVISTPPVTSEVIETEKIEEVETPEIEAEIGVVTSHKALAAAEYYQYAGLNSKEKKVYQAICDSVQKGESYIQLKQYNFPKDDIDKVYKAVRGDNPQFFYLANSYAISYNGRNGYLDTMMLTYLDGTRVDHIGENGELAAEADRTVIASQIKAFNDKVEEILKLIPVSATEVRKEKIIYDYLQDTIAYDYDSAQFAGTASEVACHAFDAYGAACEGLSVCEGYSELFQYLCYCVGINSTKVCGKASGGYHMWNTVQLGTGWYMLDATWDDPAVEGLHYYNYFNLTATEMGANHNADPNELRIPSCTATEYAACRVCAMEITSLRDAPSNYKQIIDDLVNEKASYLCIYMGNYGQGIQQYISTQILSPMSGVQRYIKEQGYQISISSQYFVMGKLCYIKIER